MTIPELHVHVNTYPARLKGANMSQNYSYFAHKECEYFPCHKGADPENFNCLFCYCPLYALGRNCGGAFQYKENGIKDCTNCLFPHRRENYQRVIARYKDILGILKRLEAESRTESGENA